MNLTGKLKLTRIGLEKEFNKKLKYKNLLNKDADYSLLGFEKYKQTLRNAVGKTYPNKEVEVNEIKFGKFEKLYNKYGLKQSQFI